MQVALLGLGKMGKQLAEKLMNDGHQVMVWNRSKDVLEQYKLEKAEYIVKQRLFIAHTFEDIRSTLLKPHVIWSMLPAGEPTEKMLAEMDEFIGSGDILIDGGNANYKDSEQRAQVYQGKGVKFLGIGVSGGVHGLQNGFSVMVGGDKDAYVYIKPILDSLAKPNGAHGYFGTGGAGHFVKMVHNGIEYGMMQSLAEGFGVLAKSKYKFNLTEVAKTWQKGSIVSSFLLQMVSDALAKDPALSEYDGTIDAKGEGQWTVDEAKALDLPVEAIERALDFRKRSQYDSKVQQTFAARLVAAMRHEFGGHAKKIPQQQEAKKE